ncbi:FixH family protein [Fulvivirga sp. 29W222]|uniref:FixH family protein n=1 Tax=Fulvivirga marina TaxID=2494733 RepID=A0A937G299_9BACT|nr:FixH family protein [Fulvivirga marina]MBL6449362.1 FixH family protein [Fulvivirga marina]
MNWGTKIVVSFILFVGLIATMVIISMRQDVSLVAKDYYVQEIAYQDQIERIKNYKGLGDNQVKLKYEVQTDKIVLILPKSYAGKGEVHFFRPSDASLDARYVLKPDAEGYQHFHASDFKKGLWRVKISWHENDREYYEEKTLII